MAELHDIYQKAIDGGMLNKSVSEERFGKILQDDKEREDYYNYVKKKDPNFYSSDYAVFSQNAAALFKKPVEQAFGQRRAASALGSMPDPLYSGQYQYQNQAVEQARKLDAENVAELPISQEDRERQSEIDRLNMEGMFGKPNGTSYSIDKQTGMPVFTKTEGDGIKLYTGLNSNSSEVKRLEKEKPSYLTREVKTPQDIYANTLEAWTANTPDGKAAYEQTQQDLKEVENSLTRDFMAKVEDIKKQYQSGAIGYDEAEQQLKQASADARDIYEAEVNTRNATLFSKMTTANEPYLNQQVRQLGQKAVNKQTKELFGRISPMIEQLRSASVTGGGAAGMYGALSKQISENSTNAENKRRLQILRGAQKFLNDASEISIAAQQQQGIGKGFSNAITDEDTWDLGIAKMIRSADLKNAVEKYEKDPQSLTEEERALLDAGVTYMAACAYNSDKLSRLYKAGQTTGESVPFMLQFAVMPIASIRSGVMKGLLGYGLESMGGVGLEAGAKFALGTAAKEAGALLAGNLAAAGLQTLSFGAPKVAEGTISRMTGDIKPVFDDSGRLVYGGRENQQSGGEAFRNAMVDMYVENLSEMLLTTTDPLKAWARGSKMFAKMDKSILANTLQKIHNSAVGKIGERMQFRNYAEEIKEEYLGNLLQWGLSSDVNSAKEAGLDIDSQIDMWLGLAPTSLFFVGLGAANVAYDKARLYQDIRKMRGIVEDDEMRKSLEELLKADNSSEVSRVSHDSIKWILKNKDIGEDEKRGLLTDILGVYQTELAKETEEANAVQQNEEETAEPTVPIDTPSPELTPEPLSPEEEARRAEIRKEVEGELVPRLAEIAFRSGDMQDNPVIYRVADVGNPERQGYIVAGSATPDVDAESNPDKMLFTNGAATVTVRWDNEAAPQMLTLNDLNLLDMYDTESRIAAEVEQRMAAQEEVKGSTPNGTSVTPDTAPAIEKEKPNLDLMTADELGAATVEYLEDKQAAIQWLTMQLEQAKKEAARVSNKRAMFTDDIDEFKRQNAAVQRAKREAQAVVSKLEAAINAASAYKTAEERAEAERAEAARKAKYEARRKTEEAMSGSAPAEKWNSIPREVGNAVTRTLPDGTKISGHYVLAEAGTATASHDPFNSWNTSNGFPTTEDGRNINDRDHKNDKDAQSITEQIARTYDGQAVEQVPVVSNEGIVYDGNGRTIAGNIAAANNTDQAYLQALAENAHNFGFTEEQLKNYQHPRVYLQLDENLPYSTQTFAQFNQQEKKSQSSANRAVANSKKLTESARDGILQVINEYATLDSFFQSETGAKDVIASLLDNGIITQQEVAGLTEATDKGFLLSPAGKDAITDLLIGALFDEQTIRMLGNDKGLKQSILRALPSIVENRKLEEYALTDNIREAIQLLYEARQAGMAYNLYVLQGNAFDGYVSERFSPFSMLLAEEMTSGVEEFRQVLNLYNNSAKDEVGGQGGLFEPRTTEDIKNEILNYYGREAKQPAGVQRVGYTQTQPAVPGTHASAGQEEVVEPTPEPVAEKSKEEKPAAEAGGAPELMPNEVSAEEKRRLAEIEQNRKRITAANKQAYSKYKVGDKVSFYEGGKVLRGEIIAGDGEKFVIREWISKKNNEYKDYIELALRIKQHLSTGKKEEKRPTVWTTELLAQELTADQKDELLDAISDGETKVEKIDNKTLLPTLAREGVGQKVLADVKYALLHGNDINGFYVNGKVFLNMDVLKTGMDVLTKFVHERQHRLDYKDPSIVKNIMLHAPPQDLAAWIKAITGSDFYDNYLRAYNEAGDNVDMKMYNHAQLATEFLAPIMERVYAEEKTVAEVCREYGIINQDVINIINSVDNEQRKDERLSRARRVSLLNAGQEGLPGENEGNTEAGSGREMDRSGHGTVSESNQGGRERAEEVAGQKRKSAAEVEAGGALVSQLKAMGVPVSTDLEANREALKKAKSDNSEAGKIHYYKTQSGEQYGFSYKGRIYLDPRKVDAELPIHEYGHLWSESFRRLNPTGWQNVVEVIKRDADAWAFVRSLRPELTDENDIVEEVIATYSGKRGAEKLRKEFERMAKRDKQYESKWQNIFANISKAIQDFWKAVGDFLHIRYESAEQVYDQVLKDFVNRMNPRQRIEDYLKERDAEYLSAAESGDMARASQIFEEALQENIGNGITPYVSVGQYNDLRRLARGVKTRNKNVIAEAARMIAPLIPDNAVLVPAPSHTGAATDMLDLSNAIAAITGSEVADVLKGVPRESQYATKKQIGAPLSSREMGIVVEGQLPAGKLPVVIDNVVDSGNTAEACVNALGKGIVVSLANSADMYRHAASLKSAAPVLRDRKGNIVPLSQRFDMNESRYLGRIDAMFSIGGTGIVPVNDKTLVGLHNINSEKLRKVIKAGGLANPSAAVIDLAKQDHHDYGEISLVLPSDMVEHAAGTYAGDAWTPTYPHVEYKQGKDTEKRITDAVKGLPASLADAIYYRVGDYMSGNRYTSGLEYIFLKNKGEEMPIQTNKRHYPDISIEEVCRRLGLEYPGYFSSDAYEAYEKLPEDQVFDYNLWFEKYGKEADIQRVKDKISELREEGEDRAADALTERYSKPLFFNYFDSIGYRILKDERDAGEENIGATLDAAANRVDELGLRNEFDEWQRKMIDSFGYDEVLFAGWTPSGNKRYLPNTVENASRLMNKNSETNYLERQSVNETKAMLMDKFKTLAQIRKHRNILENDEEKIREAYEQVSSDWAQLGIDFRDYTTNEDKTAYGLDDNQFIAIDNALARLQEAMLKRDPIAFLNREYRYSLPADSEFGTRLAEMVQRIKNLPSRYFETKFRRPVYLSEFAAAVVPNNLADDLKQGLRDNGLPLYEYDSKEIGSRREATLLATDRDDVLFSISSSPSAGENLTPAAAREMQDIKERSQADGTFMQAPNGKPTNLNERQWLQVRTRAFKRWSGDWENDPKNATKILDENGEPLVVYHGTKRGNNFYAFENNSQGIHFGSIEQAKARNAGRLIPVFLNIRNMERTLDQGAFWNFEVKYAKERGIDGFVYSNEVEGNGDSYVVFTPNQIKSATDNDGSFSEDNDDIRFSISNQNNDIFYSNAERAVENIQQEKATPEQWKAMIEKAGGLKAGEDKWIGLSEWLDKQRTAGIESKRDDESMAEFAKRVAGHKVTLTKQQILDYIRQNKIQIEEVHYGGDGKSIEDTPAFKAYQEEYQQLFDKAYKGGGIDGWMKAAEDAMGEMMERHGGDDFGMAFWGDQRTLRVGDINAALYFITMDGSTPPINDVRLGYTTNGLDNKREIALTVPTIESYDATDEVHFGDAGEGRAIAWVRFGDAKAPADGGKKLVELDEVIRDNDRWYKEHPEFTKYGIGGEELKEESNRRKQNQREKYDEAQKVPNSISVLVIDEIQSKRHQDARERGYDDFDTVVKEVTSKFNVSEQRVRNDAFDVANAISRYDEDLAERLTDAYNRHMNNAIPPAAPFEKNWHELVMKRMMRFAAENGYDKLAWTTGAQQAERYDIGAQVEKIVVEPYGAGMRDVKVYKPDGYYDILTFDSNGICNDSHYGGVVAGKTAKEVFGKDLGEKIAAAAENTTIDGVNLHIGAEGMSGFYDDILPRFMQKYGKKWGVKVEDIKLPYLSEGGWSNDGGRGLIMHSIDINDAMRESVLNGQPMFSIGGVRGAENMDKADEVFERYDEMLRAAQNDAERGYIMRDFLNNYMDADVLHYDICFNDDEAMEFLTEVRGMSEDEAKEYLDERFRKAIGQFDEGYIFIWGNKITNISELRSVYIHENQHQRNELLNFEKERIILNSTPEELARFLREIYNGEDHYDYLLKGKNDQEKAAGFEALADEVLAHGLQICYMAKAGEDFEQVLRRHGITNETVIQVIYEELERHRRERAYLRSNSLQGKVDLPHVRSNKASSGEIGRNTEGQPGIASIRRNLSGTERDGGSGEELERLRTLAIAHANNIRVEREYGGQRYSFADEEPLFSIRKEPAPKKTGIGYKVFYEKDGKLYPPMVANPNGEDTPVGVWLNADAAPIVGESKTGRSRVKAGGKGTQGGSGRLAYRPGWHLGEIPYALQFNRKDENGEKKLFPKDFVWAEVEYAADNDYQKEAEANGMSESGKYRHAYAGLKRIPKDGFYRYRTNPNPDTDPWIITGAMKVNRVLTNEEVDELVRAAGREPQIREAEQPMFSISGNEKNNMTRIEIITRALVEQSKYNYQLMHAALKQVGSSLNELERAMQLQADFDRNQVAALLNLTNTLMHSEAWGNNLRQSDIGTIFTQIRNAIGKQDISREVKTIMRYLVNAQRKAAQRQWNDLLQTKIQKLNISGVVSQGKVALQGQYAMQALKDALYRQMTVPQLEEQISELSDAEMNAGDNSIKEQLKGRMIGYVIAAQHIERTQDLQQEFLQLEDEWRSVQSDKKYKPAAKRQLEDAIQQSIQENILKQADAFIQSSKDLQEYIENQHAAAKGYIDRINANREKIRDYAAKDLAGTATNPNRLRTSTQVARQIWEAFSSPIRDLQSLLRMVGMHAPDGEGYLYNHFMRGWTNAADEERRGIIAAQKTLDEKVKELTNGKYQTWLEAAQDVKSKSHKMIEVEMLNGVDGNGAPITETMSIDAGNALYIYAVNKMLDGKMKLRAMNISEEDVEALKNAVREQLGQELINLVDWVQSEFFVSLRNRYNPTHEALFGAPMDAIENYFPLRINPNERQKNEDLGDPDTDASRLLTGTSTGSIKRRTKNSLGLDVRNADFFQEVIRHVSQMERWNAFAQWTRDANILFSDINFRNRVKGLNTIYGTGDKLYNFMKDAFKVANGTYRPKADTFSEVALNVAKGVTSAKINFRLFTALKQLASFPAFFTYMTDGEFVKSYVQSWAHPHDTMHWAKATLPNFEKRVSKRDMGDMRLMQRTTDWQWLKHTLDWSSKYGMAANVYFDTLTCATGARAVYESHKADYLRKGYSAEEAEKRAAQDAEQAFNTSQQSSEGAYMAPIQLDRNLITSALTVFRTSPMQYTRNFIYHTRGLLNKMKSGSKAEQIAFRTAQYKADGLNEEQATQAAIQDYNKSMRSDIIGFVVYGALLNIIWRLAAQVPYLVMGDDDDKKKDALKQSVTGGALVSPLTGLLGGGIVEQALDGYGDFADIFSPDMPFTQDVKRVSSYLKNEKYAEAANMALSIVLQSSTGIDPNTAAEMVMRTVTTLNSDAELDAAEQAWQVTAAVLNIPQSQYEQLLVDRVMADEGQYDAVLEDYTRYKLIQTAPLTWYLRSEDAVDRTAEAAQNRLDKLIEERQKLTEDDE